MPRTVYECNLQILISLKLAAVLFIKPLWDFDKECRETQVESDASFFALRILVEASCGLNS